MPKIDQILPKKVLQHKMVAVTIAVLAGLLAFTLSLESIFKAADLARRVWFFYADPACTLVTKQLVDASGASTGEAEFIECPRPDGSRPLFLRAVDPDATAS